MFDQEKPNKISITSKSSQINRVINLKQRNNQQLFYPKNYCPLPQRVVQYTKGSNEVSEAYQWDDSKVSLYSRSSDTAGWYQNRIFISNSVSNKIQDINQRNERHNDSQKN